MGKKIEVESGNPYRDNEGRFDTKDGADSASIFSILDFDNMDEDLVKMSEEGKITLTSEQQELLDSLGYGDVELSLINQFYDLDKEKIMNASEENLKQLLKAKLLLSKVDSLIEEDSELQKINSEIFTGLWKDSKRASDYETLANELSENGSGKSKFDAKRDFFLSSIYSGPKEEKLLQLDKLKELGEKYSSRKQELTQQYEKLKEMVDFYVDKSSPYSEDRKNKAIIIKKGEDVESVYGKQTYELLNKLQKEDPDAYNCIQFYTGSFSVINEPLRGVRYMKTDKSPLGFTKTVEAMTRAIDKSIYDFDFYVERGAGEHLKINDSYIIDRYSSDEELHNLIGQEFKQQSFFSSSAEQGKAFDKTIQLKVYCPRGTKGMFVEPLQKIDMFKGQNEILIQRGYSYRITGVKREGSKIKIDCEVVLGSDEEKYNSDDLKRIERTYVG